jgi:hypothetical protein
VCRACRVVLSRVSCRVVRVVSCCRTCAKLRL